MTMLSLFAVSTPSQGATAHSSLAAATSPCPTDYPSSTVGSTTSSTTCTTTPISGYTLVLVASSVFLDIHTVRVDWKVCIKPPSAVPNAGAGLAVQFYVDGVALTGTGATGTILNDGSGCTTDPNYPGCFSPGPHVGTATVAGLGNTNAADFTVPAGVVCAASTTPVATGGSAAGSSSGGALAFTGANILRLLLIALALVLVGAVITYIARERRRSRSL